ncbi:MAG: large subunit ribosomal protein [Thermoplasmata archaeon]|jgi:large subunit ribosomal protein L13|nr:large subunit ribosomal protein [Thermoplasmata archaeon]
MSGAKHYNPVPTIGTTRNVVVIDATGLVLGRMATHVAKHAIEGDEVHIVNAERAIVVGSSKKAIQEHYLQKRHVGTMRKGPFFPREPHLMVKRTCRGMINYQSSAGRAAYKRIKAHIGVPKELAGQKALDLPAAKRAARTYLTVAEISGWLGSNRAQKLVEA